MNTTTVPGLCIRNLSLKRGKSRAQAQIIRGIAGFKVIIASPGTLPDQEGEYSRVLGDREVGRIRNGYGWVLDGEAEHHSRGGLFLSKDPSLRPPSVHLDGQSLFPDSIISAPAGEVQGSFAMKHAVLHVPNISCIGWEDVFSFALHPART